MTTMTDSKALEMIRTGDWSIDVSEAFAHIAARLREPAVVGGWVMVPRVPTEAMLSAAHCELADRPFSNNAERSSRAYAAMLASAPQPPSGGEVRCPECDGAGGQRWHEADGSERGDRCDTCDGFGHVSAPPSAPVVDRVGAVKLAQAAAYASHHTHDYLPHTAEEARNWQPHGWVVDAILAATLEAAPQQASAPVGVIGDAIQHLSKWLDANDCECESGHQCGRTEVERTRDQLRALAPQTAPSATVGVEAVRYDAGLLSDYGGGNVEWWQDYIRAELERAHDFYTDALAQQPASDGGFTAADMMVARQEGREEAQQHAAVDDGTATKLRSLYDRIRPGSDCAHWIHVEIGQILLAAQPGGSDNA